MPAEMYFNEETEIERHKLAIPKPWFSPSFSVDNSNSISKDTPVSDSLVFEEFRPVSVQSIPHTPNLYHNTETNQPIQESSTIDVSRDSRLCPRSFVDKISKWSIFKSSIKCFHKTKQNFICCYWKNICFKIYISYIYIYIHIIISFLGIYFYAFPEQQKINIGYFLFQAEQKAEKARKDMVGKCQSHEPKHPIKVLMDKKSSQYIKMIGIL